MWNTKFGQKPRIFVEQSSTLELNMNSAFHPSREHCLFLSLLWLFWGLLLPMLSTMANKSLSAFSHKKRTICPKILIPMLSTMADKSSSALSHKERIISPETASQASDQPGDNVSLPTPQMQGKLNDSFKLEDNLTKGVSFLTNAYKQFTNKPIQDCIKDGFPLPFLRCQNPQATESSINADVSMSQPERSYLHATDNLGPMSFPSSYVEYTTV